MLLLEVPYVFLLLTYGVESTNSPCEHSVLCLNMLVCLLGRA